LARSISDRIDETDCAPAEGTRATASATISPEAAAYERAHRAHFDDRDFAKALALWTDFLQGVPGSKWEPEARYNHALCLLRLGRHAEGARELGPFARGVYGTYRQNEARLLLSGIEDAGL
jgi:TolA-binding protein